MGLEALSPSNSNSSLVTSDLPAGPLVLSHSGWQGFQNWERGPCCGQGGMGHKVIFQEPQPSRGTWGYSNLWS